MKRFLLAICLLFFLTGCKGEDGPTEKSLWGPNGKSNVQPKVMEDGGEFKDIARAFSEDENFSLEVDYQGGNNFRYVVESHDKEPIYGYDFVIWMRPKGGDKEGFYPLSFHKSLEKGELKITQKFTIDATGIDEIQVFIEKGTYKLYEGEAELTILTPMDVPLTK
ncbi:MAG: membrane lipoprotein lipid attachment site-containing protein [Tissierellia bacterium]|nr:membrane lipoprotein lipid attachment site-containing protein [Tissierellia bacterium]